MNGTRINETCTYSAGDFTVFNISVNTSTTTTTTLTITTTGLSGGTAGTAYTSTTLSASGGTGTRTWSLASGSLPAGLTLSSAGIISGTPTTANSYNFTIQVSDGSSHTATQNYSVTIASASTTTPLTIATSSLSDGTVNAVYTRSLSASGGSGTRTWSLASGSLPAGLTLSSAGVISGTPTTADSYNFTIQVSDGSSHTATQNYSVTIASASTTTPAETRPPTTATTITSYVGGTSGSFSVSGGTVASATSLSSSNGNVSVSIAANTAVNLQGTTQFSINELASNPTPPSGSRTIKAYSCGPDNSTFSPAITLTLKYSTSDLPEDVSESSLYIALLENNNWSKLNSTVNTSAKTVTAQIAHFSTYAVLGKVKDTSSSGEAAFVTSNLTAFPSAIEAGQTVSISAKVTNNGTGTGSKIIKLKINDESAGENLVTLSPGASRVVTFTVTKSKAGTYTVNVEGESSTFQVTAASSQKDDSSSGIPTAMMFLILGGGVLLIIFLLVMILKKRSDY